METLPQIRLPNVDLSNPKYAYLQLNGPYPNVPNRMVNCCNCCTVTTLFTTVMLGIGLYRLAKKGRPLAALIVTTIAAGPVLCCSLGCFLCCCCDLRQSGKQSDQRDQQRLWESELARLNQRGLNYLETWSPRLNKLGDHATDARDMAQRLTRWVATYQKGSYQPKDPASRILASMAYLAHCFIDQLERRKSWQASRDPRRSLTIQDAERELATIKLKFGTFDFILQGKFSQRTSGHTSDILKTKLDRLIPFWPHGRPPLALDKNLQTG